jgi:hypothetical protein
MKMQNSKYHLEKPEIKKLVKLDITSSEFQIVSKTLNDPKIIIESISRIHSPDNWRKYQNQKLRLSHKLSINPSEKIFYHLTKCSSAQNILNNGFNIKFSKLRAFGKGINFCSEFKNIIKYYGMYSDRKERSALIINQVIIGKAHANSSDEQQIMTNPDGSYYTKPQFLSPKKGYDAMYSKTPYKEIWVIPSTERIYPIYLIILKRQN